MSELTQGQSRGGLSSALRRSIEADDNAVYAQFRQMEGANRRTIAEELGCNMRTVTRLLARKWFTEDGASQMTRQLREKVGLGMGSEPQPKENKDER